MATNVRGRVALVKLTTPRLPATTLAQIANNGALSGVVAVLLTPTLTVPQRSDPSFLRQTFQQDGEYLSDTLQAHDQVNLLTYS